MLDTWSLRVLVEVAGQGSFSAAAAALSMTQPAVSRQIAGVEKRLGVRLFRRVPRGVNLTAAGSVAVELAEEILARMRAMESRMRAFGDLHSGHVRLAAFASANTYLVPETIRRFSVAHPGVQISLRQLDRVDPVAAVRLGTVDLALLTSWNLSDEPSDRDGTELIPLADEDLQVALPAGHRLARRRRVPLDQLRGETWIEGAHPDCLGPDEHLAAGLGGAPHVGFVCDDWNGKQALVACGAGITLVPALARTPVRPDVVLRPTSPPLPSRRLYVAAPTVPFRTPAVTAMLTLLAAAAATAAPHRKSGSRAALAST